MNSKVNPETVKLGPTQAPDMRGLCTPEQHAQTHKVKPVILLGLGTGPHGKTALLEFPEGWQRTIDLLTEFDGWHPMFDDLSTKDRRSLHEHVEAPFTTHPDGTKSRPDPLSFIRRVETGRGKFLRYNYFDVPAQDYAEGAATGYRCAAELLAALALGHGPVISIFQVLAEVAEAKKGSFDGVNRRAAAAAFLGIMGDALTFFARHGNHRAWLDKRIAGAEKYAQDAAERRAIERAEFVERMKAGKAFKRLAREAATCGSAA